MGENQSGSEKSAIRCTDTKLDGMPCTQFAVPETHPPVCPVHLRRPNFGPEAPVFPSIRDDPRVNRAIGAFATALQKAARRLDREAGTRQGSIAIVLGLMASEPCAQCALWHAGGHAERPAGGTIGS